MNRIEEIFNELCNICKANNLELKICIDYPVLFSGRATECSVIYRFKENKSNESESLNEVDDDIDDDEDYDDED